MAPRPGGSAARAVTGIVGRAAQKMMPKVAAKATRTSTRQAGRVGARTGARQSARTGGRGAGRQTGRRTADNGTPTRPVAGRTTTSDPIDIATGEVLLHQVDLELPGVLPLVLDRTHVSSFRAGRWFGPGWSSTLDQRLEIDGVGACLVTTEGRVLTYPIGMYGEPVMPLRGERWPLTINADGYTIAQPQQGITLHFAAQPNARIPGEQALVLPLQAITDRNDNRVDLDYDGNGTLVRVRHSGGYVIDIDTEDGLVTALRSGDTVLKHFGYDDAANLTTVAGPSGVPTRFDYDDAGRLTRWTDTNGQWYAYTYDQQGRAIRGTGKDGYLNATLTYHDDRTILTDALGHSTTYHLNDQRQVTAETNPLGAVTHYEWDDNDQLLSTTDPLGRTTRYTYDPLGNVTTITRPDGAVAAITYNDHCLPQEVTGFDGAVTRLDYDDRGNLITETGPFGEVIRYAYDGHGGLAAVTDPTGVATRIQCARAGLPAVIDDPRGATTRYSYDELGRVIEMTDALGAVFSFTWTPDGRLDTRTMPDGSIERGTYDEEGNLVEFTDALGGITRWEIGPFDLPIARTAPDGTRLAFAYDAHLRLTSVTNPYGLTWQYEYDAAGDLVAETDFNGRAVRYGLDAAGQLVSRTNGAGQTVAFTRDVLGKIVRKESDGKVSTYAYDRAGRPTRAVNEHCDLRIDYDVVGRVLREVSNGRILTSAYGPTGTRIHRRTPSGVESVWSHGPTGLPRTLTIGEHTVAFEHDPCGREIRRHIGGSVILDQQWDSAHRLTSQALWGPPALPSSQGRLLQHRTYTYRTDGALAALTDRLSGDRRYDLDHAGRATAVYAKTWSEQYSYDPLGTITHATFAAAASDPAADAVGAREHVGTLIRRAGRVRYEYDAQGRVVLRKHAHLSGGSSVYRFHWDAEDRLTAVQTPDGHWWRYLYDALGRRIAKHHLASDGRSVLERTDFTWDGPTLVEQVRHVRSPERGAHIFRVTTWDYEPGTFKPLAQVEHTAAHEAPQEQIDRRFYAIVTDLIGTPTELVDPSGTVWWHSDITLWGAPRTGPAAAADFPLRFPGQYRDAETGLHYNHHRYYDPGIGRYLSPDPLGLAPQPDPHAYVANPTTWADVLGLAPYTPAQRHRAEQAAQDLAGMRRSLGLLPARVEDAIVNWIKKHDPTFKPKGMQHTLARLDYKGRSYYGMNGKTPPRPVDYPGKGNRMLPQSYMDHAEGDVISQAKASGGTGGSAALYVDREVCRFCSNSMAGYANWLELDYLEVWEPAPGGGTRMAGYYEKATDKFVRLR